MPANGPPTVTAQFLSTLLLLTWEAGGKLRLVRGRVDYQPVVELDSNSWGWSTGDGITMSDLTYITLHGAMANSDGSYTATGGVSYWLALVSGVATAEPIIP